MTLRPDLSRHPAVNARADSVLGGHEPASGHLDDGAISILEGQLRRWIGSGAAQAASGAYCAWRDAETDELAFEYPEITGYVLTYLAGRSDLRIEEEHVGRRAADWLVRRLRTGDLSARAAWDGHAVYNFDLAIIGTGLMAYGSRLGADRYIESGLRLAERLSAQVARHGRLHALAPESSSSSRRAWSTHGYAHMLKSVQTLRWADRLGLDGADESALHLLATVQRLQADDGRFITDQRSRVTMLHPHLYGTEGLWASGDTEALERARAATDWAWAHQLPTGGFPRAVGGERGEYVEQSDVTAQAIRMALVLGRRPGGLASALARLRHVASGSGDARGLIYQPASPLRHENTWATLFAAQAVGMAVEGSRLIRWDELV